MHITINNLNKQYPGGVFALQNVNLDISVGMFGLLGPNGAGKSTLMKILATLELPTSGDVTINGDNVLTHRREIRAKLGYLPQFFGAYPQMTGMEFLTYIAKLCGVSKKERNDSVKKTLAQVALLDVRDRKIKTYSGGMLRRLGIAQALVGNPSLLIVDEPTTGLDPEERIRFRNLLAEISSEKIIILSTHIVGDISSTCENIALLSLGKVVFCGRPEELINKAIGKVWQVTCDEEDFGVISSRMHVISTIPVENRLLLRVVGESSNGFEMGEVPPNLEDAYMYFMEFIIGEHIDDEENNEENQIS